MDASPRIAYTAVEAADQLGISRAHIYTLLMDGTIPSVRIGRCRRIRHDDLVAYLDSLPSAVGS